MADCVVSTRRAFLRALPAIAVPVGLEVHRLGGGSAIRDAIEAHRNAFSAWPGEAVGVVDADLDALGDAEQAAWLSLLRAEGGTLAEHRERAAYLLDNDTLIDGLDRESVELLLRAIRA